MKAQFDNILIPIDFTLNSEIAVQKAISLCSEPGISIHLLHVFKPSMDSTRLAHIFSGTSLQEQMFVEREIKEKSEAIASTIREARKDVVVLSWISYGPVEKAISQKAKELNADLIIIGKKSHHSLFPFLNSVTPGRIAKTTGIAVLTVKPGSINQPIKTIVIPMDGQLPENKLAMINALKIKNWTQIHLVAFSPVNDTPNILPLSLLNAYRRFQNNTASEINCKVLEGTNKARSILQYCKEVDADLLIAAPELETRIGWMNKHISDMLPTQSKTQVLAIA